MRKSNWLYVVNQALTIDLVFWIVIQNLFLTTVKNFSAFDIVLCTMVGIAISLIFYPLVNLISRKTPRRFSLIARAAMYLVAMVMFMFCNTIYGIAAAQVIYIVGSMFGTVNNVMLKNNLKAQGRAGEYIKWQSYGQLGYSVLTLIISLVSGLLFNVNPYLPMILGIVISVCGLATSILYKDVEVEDRVNETVKTASNMKALFVNKTMIIILFMNILLVGVYIFMQTKASLLIQEVCFASNVELAKTSLIVTLLVALTRLIRVISNLVFAKINNKFKNQSKIIYFISGGILLSNILFAIGGNVPANYVIKLVIIAIGFSLITALRDVYNVLENKAIITNIDANKQQQAFVLTSVYHNFGRVVVEGLCLVWLGFLPLEIVYAGLLLLSVSQIFVSIKMGKLLKPKTDVPTEVQPESTLSAGNSETNTIEEK